jgi:hypothetical protein
MAEVRLLTGILQHFTPGYALLVGLLIGSTVCWISKIVSTSNRLSTDRLQTLHIVMKNFSNGLDEEDSETESIAHRTAHWQEQGSKERVFVMQSLMDEAVPDESLAIS